MAGLALALAVDLRLILVGAACIAAAALYTGGPAPLRLLGLRARWPSWSSSGSWPPPGSAYVQLERLPAVALVAAVPVGLLACAILVVNNLRDIDTDAEAGKRTLAVRLGPARTRTALRGLRGRRLRAVVALALARPPARARPAGRAPGGRPVRIVSTRSDPPSLVGRPGGTARLQLVASVLLAVGLWIS